jgi:maleylpyruvate isomerase
VPVGEAGDHLPAGTAADSAQLAAAVRCGARTMMGGLGRSLVGSGRDDVAVRTDLALDEVGVLLDEIDASTSRLATSLAGAGQRGLAAPSALPSWTRAMIAAHLTWVAERYVSMTGDALAGVKTTTYPAGASERDASLQLFDHATPQEVLARLQHASAALASTWRRLKDQQWSTAMGEERIGPMNLSRLVALRLTELEVHHVDLADGYRVSDWPAVFTRICLPLRVAWLDRHHRRRPDADRHLTGRWLLVPTDGAMSWLVTARPGQTVCQLALPEADAEVSFSGPSASLLAFLLGREPEPPLVIHGDGHLARAFKSAFPGP